MASRSIILPSNGITANVILGFCDLDLSFQSNKLKKTVEASTTMHIMSFIEVDSRYSPSNLIIANIVLHDLDIHFQGEIFTCCAFSITIAQTKRMSPADLS